MLRNSFAIFVTSLLFIVSTTSLSFGAPTRQSIAVSKAYLLKSVGPKKAKLICFKSGKNIIIGSGPKLSGTKISYLLLSPTTSQKKIHQAAVKECKIYIASPACNDSCDNDGDGKRDYPQDNGCSSLTDADETTTAITPAACNDGVDNDQDGTVDYPSDPGCSTAGDGDETNSADPSTPFTVFRKPFDGDFSIGGMFDHHYPLEFVHADGVTITYTNEETTIGVDGHEGYDYDMDPGTPVLASYDGTVNFAGTEDPFYCPLLNSTVAGKFVRIRHSIQGESFESIYGHFTSIYVANGQVVKKGDLLGLSGSTGCSTRPHLHFDIQRLTNTNDGNPSSIDPSGWDSTSADPWAIHPMGTQSFRLWAPGEAPKEFRFFSLAPNPNPGNNAAVAITHMQWAGVKDDQNPNNEYIELQLDTRFFTSPTFNLEGFTIRNNANDKFTFPAGFQIKRGEKVKLYSGSGTNSANELYWGRTKGAWSNNGDCAHLIRPTGVQMYGVYFGSSSCNSLTNSK